MDQKVTEQKGNGAAAAQPGAGTRTAELRKEDRPQSTTSAEISAIGCVGRLIEKKFPTADGRRRAVRYLSGLYDPQGG